MELQFATPLVYGRPLDVQVWWHHGFTAAVDVLRYSPDGRRSAAGLRRGTNVLTGILVQLNYYEIRSQLTTLLTCRCGGTTASLLQ
jgi:hypothetical protein